MAVAETRRLVAGQAENLCEYCRCPADFSSSPYAVEYINPRAEGGTDKLDNLAWACQFCNGHKLTATEAPDPLTGAWVALFHPRQQTWEEHFEWSTNRLMLLGITPSAEQPLIACS